MRKERIGVGMGINMLLLVAMVATNILSLYHLSSSQHHRPSPHLPVPDHLLHQLTTIRATINHLTSHHSTAASSTATKSPPSDLLLYARNSPVASACHDHPDLLHRFMNYTPFSPCPLDSHLSESLILRGCHPLPRRRCFSRTPPRPPSLSSLPTHPFTTSLPDSAVLWSPSYASCRTFACLARLRPELGFDPAVESARFLVPRSNLDLTVPHLLRLARTADFPLRLALDVGAGTGTFAARMKLNNVTVLSTTMNLGAPYNEAAALRGLVPLHVPLQQRFPIYDGVVDLVRFGHAVNRWIPTVALEFLLYDADRVLRAGGFLWLDHFFCKSGDLGKVYEPLIGKLGYKILKWTVGNKTDAGGVKYGEVYLSTLLQKPMGKQK